MRSSEDWILEERSEHQHFIPWLESEPDPFVRIRVWQWLADMVGMPGGRGTEERPGVFAARVPRTSVGVIWTLDWESKQVILARVGPI